MTAVDRFNESRVLEQAGPSQRHLILQHRLEGTYKPHVMYIRLSNSIVLSSLPFVDHMETRKVSHMETRKFASFHVI